MRYFPFLRSKQYEMLAVRHLASDIARSGCLIPICEPVKLTNSMRKSISQYKQHSMPFLFICNPAKGEFKNAAKSLVDEIIDPYLKHYDNWTPSLFIYRRTTRQEIDAFRKAYNGRNLAMIYYGLPSSRAVQTKIDNLDIKHHVFMPHCVGSEYIQSIPTDRRVIINDPFQRRARNVEYYDRQEFFTEMNTQLGNRDNVDFGDFSIVGDHYMEGGGPAYAVALHHIHFNGNANSLNISHFISDRTETRADTSGKTIEAVNHLVRALNNLRPNNTRACEEYRQMRATEISKSLGYMKCLAIMHHLEVILHSNGLAS